VVVLGAGLTGLSAAIDLGRAGVERRIFEKLGWPGGHAITVEDSGYRFDRTGHLLHIRDPELKRRVLGWLGDDYVEVRRRSRIWSNGVYTRYPFQANTFGLPPDVAHECLEGFVRAHFAETGDEPKNFEDFCLKHFGPGISRHFMIPYNSRLWGVHPREITSAWCQRFVPIPRLEDVLAGAVGKNDRELGYNADFVYPRLGIGALCSAMLPDAGPIELGRAPTAIDPRGRRLHFESEVVAYDALVSTIPLPVLVGLFVDPPEGVAAAARRLRCTHLYYLDVALSVPSGQDAHWIYVPEERYPFYRVGCYSHFSAAMAPPGTSNLYVELADRAEPDLETLLPKVATGLTEMGIISGPRDIVFSRLRRIDYAYVIFDHDYFQALETVQRYLDELGVVSAGRYGGWNYSSMEDALVFGREAAAKAIARVA
jgi:protoporphyrinogen oxidase